VWRNTNVIWQFSIIFLYGGKRALKNLLRLALSCFFNPLGSPSPGAHRAF
jgi:hypothetical protein